MNTLKVQWGSHPFHEKVVETLEQLDLVLADACRARSEHGLPFLISVWNPADPGGDGRGLVGLKIGIGDDRAAVQWMGEGDSEGYSPEVLPWGGPEISFDFGGVPTEETPETLRVLPASALEAAREFMRTGLRPRSLEWFTG